MTESVIRLPAVTDVREPPPVPEGYSLGRAIRALWEHSETGRRIDAVAPAEARYSAALAEFHDREPNGLYVELRQPMDSTSGLAVKNQQAGWVTTLRQRSFVARMGALILDGLVGDQRLPYGTQVAVAWLTEDQAPVASEVGVGVAAMSPHTVGAQIPVTRRLLKQSSPAVDEMIGDELTAAIGAELDRVAVEGQGGAEPVGAYTNASTIPVAAPGQPTGAELGAAENVMISNGALGGSPPGSVGYVVSPAVWQHGVSTLTTAPNGVPLIMQGQINGWPVNPFALSTGHWMVGAWSRIAIGLWGSVDVAVEQEIGARAAKGGRLVTAFLDCDIGIADPRSFVRPA